MASERFSLKPKFVLLQALGERAALYGMFLVLFTAPYAFMFMEKDIKPETMERMVNTTTSFLLLYIVMVIIFTILQYLTYKKTTYHFHDDKLVYNEGFFNIEKKEIQYSKLLEIIYKQNIFQRFTGLGSVLLTTAATHQQGINLGLGSTPGIKIADLQQPEEHYERIKSLIYAKQEN